MLGWEGRGIRHIERGWGADGPPPILSLPGNSQLSPSFYVTRGEPLYIYMKEHLPSEKKE